MSEAPEDKTIEVLRQAIDYNTRQLKLNRLLFWGSVWGLVAIVIMSMLIFHNPSSVTKICLLILTFVLAWYICSANRSIARLTTAIAEGRMAISLQLIHRANAKHG